MQDFVREFVGDYQIVIKRRENSDTYDLVVLHSITDPETGRFRTHKVFFDGPDMVFAHQKEAVMIDYEVDTFMTFSGEVANTVQAMFYAIAQAMGMDVDAKKARREGELIGENRALRNTIDRILPSRSPLTFSDG